MVKIKILIGLYSGSFYEKGPIVATSSVVWPFQYLIKSEKTIWTTDRLALRSHQSELGSVISLVICEEIYNNQDK